MPEATHQHSPPEPEERPGRNHGRFLRRLAIASIIIVVALIALAAFLPALMSLDAGKNRILAAASRAIGAPVEADSLSLSWLGGQSLTGLRIGSPAGFPPDEDVVRAEKVSFEGGLIGLFFQQGEARVEVEKPFLNVRTNEDGATNIEVLGRRAGGVGDGDGHDAPRDEEPPPGPRNPRRRPGVRFPSRTFSLVVRDGAVLYLDDRAGTGAEMRGIDAECRLGPGGLALRADAELRHPGPGGAPAGRLSARADVEGWGGATDPGSAAGDLAMTVDVRAEGIDLAPWQGLLDELGGISPGAGPLSVKATARVEGGKGSGRIDASGGLRCRGWTVEDCSADVDFAENGLSVRNGIASVNGGRAVLESFSAELGTTPSFRGALRIEGAAANYELTQLLSYVVPFLSLSDREAEFHGSIDGTLALEGTGGDRPALERSIRGKGSLRVRDGSLSASRFFQEAAKIAGADLAKVLFSEIGSDFEIAEATVRCEKVFLVGKPGSKLRNLGLKGESTFDGRIDFGVDLASIEETVGSKRIRRILEGARKVFGDSVFPLKLKGTLRSPELAFDAAQGFPGLDAILNEEKGASIEDLLDSIRSKRRKEGKR